MKRLPCLFELLAALEVLSQETDELPTVGGTMLCAPPIGWPMLLPGLFGTRRLDCWYQLPTRCLPIHGRHRSETGSMQERWPSAEKIAAHLGVNWDTIHKWITRKEMCAHRIEHKRRARRR